MKGWKEIEYEVCTVAWVWVQRVFCATLRGKRSSIEPIWETRFVVHLVQTMLGDGFPRDVFIFAGFWWGGL